MLEQRAGRGLPTPLDEEPELLPGLEVFWNAWNSLHSMRPCGFGPAPLPLADIAAYLELRSIRDPDLKADYLELLLAMDATWLGWARNKVELERENKRKKAK